MLTGLINRNRYKDREEFFRYVPRDSPQYLIYNVDGIILNVYKSTSVISFYLNIFMWNMTILEAAFLDYLHFHQ